MVLATRTLDTNSETGVLYFRTCQRDRVRMHRGCQASAPSLLEANSAGPVSVYSHRAVFFASVLMRKVMASRVRATVLFATETGKSEALARDLAALFSYAFNTKVPS